MKHQVSPLGKVSMMSQALDPSLDRVAVHFECLGHAMKKNSARQHEFSVLLRVLSSRFDRRSAEHQALRLASQIAQNKSIKLRNLVVGLGWRPSKPRRVSSVFLVRFRLAQSVPLRLTIPLLHLITEKAIRGRSLDPFYSSERGRRQKAKCRTRYRVANTKGRPKKGGGLMTSPSATD